MKFIYSSAIIALLSIETVVGVPGSSMQENAEAEKQKKHKCPELEFDYDDENKIVTGDSSSASLITPLSAIISGIVAVLLV